MTQAHVRPTAEAYCKEAAGSNAFIYEVLVDNDVHRLVWTLSEVARWAFLGGLGMHCRPNRDFNTYLGRYM